MKRRAYTTLLLVLAGLFLCSMSCDSELPFNEIGHNAESGWVVKGQKYGNGTFFNTPRILLFADRADGIGTVVVMDTMRLGQVTVSESLEMLASIKESDFLTYPIGRTNICMLSSATGKTWCVDLGICTQMMLDFDPVEKMIRLFADPDCSGIVRPQ